MKTTVFAVLAMLMFFSDVENSAAVIIQEAVVGSATLSDGSSGADIRFGITNDTAFYLRAFAVGNNTAIAADIRYTGDGEWSAAGVITRPDTSSNWQLTYTGPSSAYTPDIGWLTAADLPGFTSAFIFGNDISQAWGDLEPGGSLGGTEATFDGRGRFQAIADAIASDFAALGVDPGTGGQTTFAGQTVIVSAVPLPASLLLFLPGLISLGFMGRTRIGNGREAGVVGCLIRSG